ncbi:MAG: protein translocase subunit SecF [Candidatus Zambryskibacteria bacterium]|nr:protein translocase subunit SecF [Candidatus Zambryskibacteria bacterium]
MTIVKYRIIFFILSLLLIAGSFGVIAKYGLNYGIDFKGGSILGVTYVDVEGSVTPTLTEVKTILADTGLSNTLVSPRGDKGYVIKMRELSSEEKNATLRALTLAGSNPVTVEKFNAIGPVVGDELRSKAYVAIVVVLFCIILFILFAFRKVKNPLNYGIATIVALAHDVIIPTGIYVLWSQHTGAEIDLLFVSALLAILGYSVHDTIVVFDRVRENALKNAGVKNGLSFEEVVGKSVTETMARSINTSLTTAITLLALYFVGGSSTQNFAFILLMGIIVGTYSSIFIASPLLVTLEGWRKKK